jgi:ABC-type multidrug transport system fused ATPase/permease subunit
VIIIIVQYIFKFAETYIFSYFNESVIYAMRREILGKIQRLRMEFYDNNHTSKITNTFFNQMEIVKDFVVENVLDMIKIHPCVFIKTAGTSYYETACGSGTVAAGLVASVLKGHGTNLTWLQPSGKFIQSSVEYQDGKIIGAKISGNISSISDVLEG